MIIKKNEFDDLIFEYLEGNLSLKEKEAFEMILSDNSNLRDEVNAWRNTFIEEPLPVTTSLERTLIGSYQRTRWSLFLNSIFYLPLVILFSSSNINEELHSTFAASNNSKLNIRSSITRAKCNTLQTQQGLVYPSSRNKSVAIKKIIIPATSQVYKEEKLIITSKLPIVETNLEQLTMDVKKEIDSIWKERKDISAQTHKRQFLKKEVRELNRKKRRDKDKASEAKFINGHVPYVIPLDVTNF